MWSVEIFVVGGKEDAAYEVRKIQVLEAAGNIWGVTKYHVLEAEEKVMWSVEIFVMRGEEDGCYEVRKFQVLEGEKNVLSC